MTDRLRKVRRLLAVQSQMERIEQWRLAEIEGRKATLEAQQADALAAQRETETLAGALAEQLSRRMRRLVRETGEAERDKAVQIEAVRQEVGKLKAATRIAGRAEQEAARAGEARALADVSERVAAAGTKPSRSASHKLGDVG